MPGTISHRPRAFKPHGPEKLQAARDKADESLQRLRESGEDLEAAEVLFARFEDLKKRHERLCQLQESLPSDDAETPTEEEATENKDEEEPESAPQELQVVRLEGKNYLQLSLSKYRWRYTDGAYKCIFGELVYPMPDDLNVEDPSQLVIGLADQFIKLALDGIGEEFDNLHDVQISYLANIYADLTGQKERIDKLQAANASRLAIEVAGQLYINDALRFLQNSDLIIKLMVPTSTGSDTEPDASEEVADTLAETSITV
ncbi:hypothetical protein DXG01_010776 [Tephrocybe rancida]|nr:hypothetical protein DXG01_010776 [Tephrocybe rancida]